MSVHRYGASKPRRVWFDFEKLNILALKYAGRAVTINDDGTQYKFPSKVEADGFARDLNRDSGLREVFRVGLASNSGNLVVFGA